MKIASYWFTGLSGTGKTTLAYALSAVLTQQGIKNQVLDGDELRKTISADLGFSKQDRDIQVQRVCELASELQAQHIIPIVSLISPYAEARSLAIQKLNAMEIYLETPLSVLQARDVKGLYAKALRGELKNLTGVDAPYDVPESPRLHLRTDLLSINDCIKQLLNS